MNLIRDEPIKLKLCDALGLMHNIRWWLDPEIELRLARVPSGNWVLEGLVGDGWADITSDALEFAVYHNFMTPEWEVVA